MTHGRCVWFNHLDVQPSSKPHASSSRGFLDGVLTCIVKDMASLFMYCVGHCGAGTPLPLLPHTRAILYLTHGGAVCVYHVDVPTSSMQYPSTTHGFWMVAPHALSTTWPKSSHIPSSVAAQVLRSRYYHTVWQSCM